MALRSSTCGVENKRSAPYVVADLQQLRLFDRSIQTLVKVENTQEDNFKIMEAS